MTMAKTSAVTARPRMARVQWGQILLHIVLIVQSLLAIVPFIWMIFASFKPFKELVSSRALLPKVWTLTAYQDILGRVNFIPAFKNSAIAAVSVTAVTVITSAAMGYIFAKYRFPGKEQLFMVLLGTMMVPFSVVLVPLYITIADMNLVNQLFGIIITGFFSTFGIFMMRQFMESIPTELIDASRIDGASEWRIFFTIVMPMAASPMGALAVFAFLGNWDSLLWPLIVLNSPAKQTLPLVLSGLRSLYWNRYELWSAGSMLTVMPVMILYSFSSKYFIKGIAMTGLKA
ncbi:MAG: carbohydrate ABC transporter permease [Anaerolineae bacterium]